MKTVFFIERSKDGVTWKLVKNSKFQTEELCIQTVAELRRFFPEYQYRVIKQVTSVMYG